MFVHKSCQSRVSFDRDLISEGDTDAYPVELYGYYYAAYCPTCEEDLFGVEIDEIE